MCHFGRCIRTRISIAFEFDRMQFGLLWKRDICSFQPNGISNEILCSANQLNWFTSKVRNNWHLFCALTTNICTAYISNEPAKSCRWPRVWYLHFKRIVKNGLLCDFCFLHHFCHLTHVVKSRFTENHHYFAK